MVVSDINADPEHEEDDSEAHEEGGDERNQQLLTQVSCELGARHFVHKEPGCEEGSNEQQQHRQVRIDCWIDRRNVPGH